MPFSQIFQRFGVSSTKEVITIDNIEKWNLPANYFHKLLQYFLSSTFGLEKVV